MSETTDKKKVNEVLGITPKKNEVFTQETVDELTDNKGDEENE